MSSFFGKIFDWERLIAIPTSALYEKYFLYIVLAILVGPILLKILLNIKKRSKAYAKFDRLWFWAYLSLGAVGLFIWFSITQGLPIFGSRLVTYIWLFSLVALKIYLFIYYRLVTLKDVKKYHEKRRKDKYLKR